MKTISLFTLLLLLASVSLGQEKEPVVEVGTVNWNRDFEAAKAEAKKTGKPIFVQFQEVPG